MRFDMHCHIAAQGVADLSKINEDVYYKPIGDELLLNFGVEKMIGDLTHKYGAKLTNKKLTLKNYMDVIVKQLNSSTKIDAVVLLAIDGIYSPRNFTRPDKKTEVKNKFFKYGSELIVSNQLAYKVVKELNKKVKKGKKFYWGASVNPNRDAASLKQEMEFLEDLKDNKPVLMKWVPSYQHIDLEDPAIFPFYDWLKDQKLPLLCHVGPEYSYSESFKPFNKGRDHYSRLNGPLSNGVTVIAPHCVSPYFSWDPDEVDPFIQYLKHWNDNNPNKLWVDNSATSTISAINTTLIKRISKMREYASKFPAEYMLNGTDFPVPIGDEDTFSKVPHTTEAQEKKLTGGGFAWPHVNEELYNKLKGCHNVFDLDILVKEHYGFKDSALTNPAKVLRLK